VLSSFDMETRAAVIARAMDNLAPNGVLMLGAGETLPDGCDGVVLESGFVRRATAARVAAA
jgi:chemotaxis methyl-accepting protein methylase